LDENTSGLIYNNVLTSSIHIHTFPLTSFSYCKVFWITLFVLSHNSPSALFITINYLYIELQVVFAHRSLKKCCNQKKKGIQNICFSHNLTLVIRSVTHLLSSRQHYSSPILGFYSWSSIIRQFLRRCTLINLS
jgi:hypothetical protein